MQWGTSALCPLFPGGGLGDLLLFIGCCNAIDYGDKLFLVRKRKITSSSCKAESLGPPCLTGLQIQDLCGQAQRSGQSRQR